MAVVVDASAALAWLVPSQATHASEGFRKNAFGEPVLAPHAFRLEMRHALIKLERRGLVGAGVLDAGLPAIEALLEIAPQPAPEDLAGVVALARSEQLGFYDALYLHLAVSSKAALASRDAMLLEAARRRGVAVRDLR